MIRITVENAMHHNIPVTVCGQTAEDISMTPLLLGLGVNELSMPTATMPLLRRTIRQLAMTECIELAEQALKCKSAAEVMELSRRMIRRRVPELADI